jgi:6-phosphofructokinase 1
MLRKEGFDARSVTLGHVQRGGKTSVQDRILGSAFGAEAVNLLHLGKSGRMLTYSDGKISSISIEQVVSNINNCVRQNDICLKIARDLGVYVGDL